MNAYKKNTPQYTLSPIDKKCHYLLHISVSGTFNIFFWFLMQHNKLVLSVQYTLIDKILQIEGWLLMNKVEPIRDREKIEEVKWSY